VETPETSIACFSYLATVTTLHVPTYPSADYGVGVDRVERFLAGDGPIVAGAASALGLSASLISNSVADDENGRYLASTLMTWGVAGTEMVSNRHVRAETPFSTVVSAKSGSRAWFPYLPGVLADLERADLSPLSVAQVAYVDCYEVLGDVTRNALNAALDGRALVIANLGGSPPAPWLVRGGLSRKIGVLQTSVPEEKPTQAQFVAEALADMALAERVVVTRGRYGAVVAEGHAREEVLAPAVTVNGVQGAGSVFSAALAVHLLHEQPLVKAAQAACNLASAWCAQPMAFPIAHDQAEPRRNEQIGG
jgi:sugar/nucleoside kinase (ribokinase family)